MTSKKTPKTKAPISSEEKQLSPEDKIKKQVEINRNREKKARILLRKVDSVLKKNGVNAAIKELMRVRLQTPLTTVIRSWLRDYRDMLDAWQNQMMPEVVDEFNEYGFRRARNLALRCAGMVTDERKVPYFITCERVLGEMADRSRLAVRDIEDEKPEAKPSEVSLDDVSEQEIQHGTKF